MLKSDDDLSGFRPLFGRSYGSTILFRDQLIFRSPTCLLVLGCWELSHVIYLKLTKKQLLVKLEKFQNDSYFYSKQHTRTILSENNHFVYLLSFARSSFFLSMRKITWLNSQQPKTRANIEHLGMRLSWQSNGIPNCISDDEEDIFEWFSLYTITYKSRLTPKKMAQKNRETGLSHDTFQILSWAFRGRWSQMTSDGEILRLRPRNFAIIPETLAPQLKKVR